jgi:hypothetical protein
VSGHTRAALDPIDAALQVGVLPQRVAEVTHAVQIACDEQSGGPVRATEIMVYDRAALTLGSTCSALRRAMEHGLVDRWGRGIYSPTLKAGDLKDALENRYLADSERREPE